jgi:hypothetical protein
MNPCSASRKVKERLNAGFGKQAIKKPSLVYFDKHQGRLRKVSQGKVQNRYQPRQGSSVFTKKWKLPLGSLRNLPACTVPFVGGTVLAFLKHRDTEDTEKRLAPTQFLCELCVSVF